MGKILLIATNPQMRRLAEEYCQQHKLQDNLIIEEGAMDGAVQIAQQYVNRDIDVVICRGGSGKSIVRDHVPLPIVDMPIRDEEVMQSIKEAISNSGKNKPKIAFLGYSTTYAQISAFIEALEIEIDHFDVVWEKEYGPLINQIKQDYDVILGGNSAQKYAEHYNIPSVIMASSTASIDMAYALARGTQLAILKEKEWSANLNAIVNTVQDGLISVNKNMDILLCNEKARGIIALDNEFIHQCIGNLKDLVPTINFKLLKTTIENSIPSNQIIDIHGIKYAMEVMSLSSETEPGRLLLLFREVKQLQQIESKARREIYIKGHTTEYSFMDILGSSSVIQKAINNAINFSHTDSHIYIYGETGTGKELFAQSIHNESKRRSGPFVAINCGAIPDSILKSELFGYEEGSFTGAKKGGKMGLFEMAHGGTLFLDEISELNPDGQVSLLRVLQENQIRRIGGEEIIPVDVRIITASNKSLTELLRQGKLREDLYYRLCVLTLNIPALNKRQEDIPILANNFINHFNQKFERRVVLDQSAYDGLKNYPWPGNIRQLKNFCERIVAISKERVITGAKIKSEITEAFSYLKPINYEEQSYRNTEKPIFVKDKTLYPSEINELLINFNGNKSKVAEFLGISRTTLWKILNKLVDNS